MAQPKEVQPTWFHRLGQPVRRLTLRKSPSLAPQWPSVEKGKEEKVPGTCHLEANAPQPMRCQVDRPIAVGRVPSRFPSAASLILQIAHILVLQKQMVSADTTQ